MPEIKQALYLHSQGYETHLQLAVHNFLNAKWEIKDIDPNNFTHYSTSEELVALNT